MKSFLQNHLFGVALLISLALHVAFILAIPSVQVVPSTSEEYTEVRLIESEEVREPASSQQDLLIGVQGVTGPITREVPTDLDVKEPEGPVPVRKPDLLAKTEEAQPPDIQRRASEDTPREKQLSPSLPLKSLPEQPSLSERFTQKSQKDSVAGLEESTDKEIPPLKDSVSTVPEQNLKPDLKRPGLVLPTQDPVPAVSAPELITNLAEKVPTPQKEEGAKAQISDNPVSNSELAQSKSESKVTRDEVLQSQASDKEIPQLKDMASIQLEKTALKQETLRSPKPESSLEDILPPVRLPSETVSRPTRNEPVLKRESLEQIQIAQSATQLENKSDIQVNKEDPSSKSVEETKETPTSKDRTPVKSEDSLTQKLLKSPEVKSKPEELLSPATRSVKVPPPVTGKEPVLEQEDSKQAQIKQNSLEPEKKVDIQINRDSLDLKPGEGSKETPTVKDKNLVVAETVPAISAEINLKGGPQTLLKEPAPVTQPPSKIPDLIKDPRAPAQIPEGPQKQKMVETLEGSQGIRPESGWERKSPLSEPGENSKEVPDTQDSTNSIPSVPIAKKITPAPPAISDKLPLGETTVSRAESKITSFPNQGLPSDSGLSKRALEVQVFNSGEFNKSSFGIPVPKEEAKRLDSLEKKEPDSLPQLTEDLQHREVPLPKGFPIKSQIQGPAGSREIIYQPPPPKVNIDVEGEVVLQFWIQPDGSVGRVIPRQKVDTRLEQAAISYIQKWRFAPLPENVAQEEQWGTISIKYKLR
ncbi:MAG TPA: TonB family protein [Candidatus Limnocylindrales bacterium]|nr:TonB family protein [Candidatus Limnocylindrales bacterium]